MDGHEQAVVHPRFRYRDIEDAGENAVYCDCAGVSDYAARQFATRMTETGGANLL